MGMEFFMAVTVILAMVIVFGVAIVVAKRKNKKK